MCTNALVITLYNCSL